MFDKNLYKKYIRPNLKNFEVQEYKSFLTAESRQLNPKYLQYIKKHGLYISLTTSPVRLKKIGVTLSIILSIPYIKKIYINIPELYRNKEPYAQKDINFIQEMSPLIQFRRIKNDIGPITKILPTIKSVRDPNAIIISVDDDIGYPVSLIIELIYCSIRYPDIIWTGSGFIWEEFEGTEDFDRKKWPIRKPRWTQVDVVEGWGAIAYKKRLVNIPLLEKLNKLDLTCKLSDDLTISYAFADKGITMKQVNTKYYDEDSELLPFDYGLQEDALHRGAGLGQQLENANIVKYVKCLDIINNYMNKSKRKSTRKSKRKSTRKSKR